MTDQTRPAPVTIDIVSDVVCPWCYVGKRRLEAALAERPDVDVTIRWHPFQLDPDVPPEGMDRKTHLIQKFGKLERIQEIYARVADAGRGEGLDFAFDKILRSVNTFDSHRLLHWALAAGVQNECKEALMKAYFMDGRNIGDPAVLGDIAQDVGMDRGAVIAALATDKDRDAVEAEIEQALRIGVSGVPFFIFAQAFAVNGAQSAEVLATAIDRAREHARDPAPAVMQA